MPAYSRPEDKEKAVKTYLQECLEKVLSEDLTTQEEYRVPVLHLAEIYRELYECKDEEVFTLLAGNLPYLLDRGWSAKEEFFSERPDLALLYMKALKDLDFYNNSKLRAILSLFSAYWRISKAEKETNYILSGGLGSLAKNLSQKNFSKKRTDFISEGFRVSVGSLNNSALAGILIPTEASNEGLKASIKRASNPNLPNLKTRTFTSFIKAREIRAEKGVEHLSELNIEELFIGLSIPSGSSPRHEWSALSYNSYLVFKLMGEFLRAKQEKEQTLNKVKAQGASPEEIRYLRKDFNKDLHLINERMKKDAGWTDPSYSRLKNHLKQLRENLREKKETLCLLLEDSIYEAFQEALSTKEEQ